MEQIEKVYRGVENDEKVLVIQKTFQQVGSYMQKVRQIEEKQNSI